MKYIKRIIMSVLLAIFFVGTFTMATNIKTPEIFSFKVESVKENIIKFSFGVENKSFIKNFNYVLKLKDKEGNNITEKKYDKTLNVKEGDYYGEIFNYNFESNKIIDKAILYLIDVEGNILSLSILSNLNLKPSEKILELQKPNCLLLDQKIECSFSKKTNISKLNSAEVIVHKRNGYGPIVRSEIIKDNLFLKTENKIILNIENLSPGYYVAKVTFDGFAESKVDIYVDGDIYLINNLSLKNNVSKKGDVSNIVISQVIPNQNERKIIIATISGSKEICGVSKNDISDSGEYAVELNQDCPNGEVVAYIINNKNNKVLAKYNSKEMSLDNLLKYLNQSESKITKMGNSFIIHGIIIILFILSIILLVLKKKVLGVSLFLLSIILILFFFTYSKISAATLTGSKFIRATINAPDVGSEDNLKISIKVQDITRETRGPDTIIFLHKKDDRVPLGRSESGDIENTDIEFDLGPKEVGRHNFYLVFKTESKYDTAIFGQSRFGSERLEYDFSINVTAACDVSTTWSELPPKDSLCVDTKGVQVEFCRDDPTGITRPFNVSGKKIWEEGEWKPWHPRDKEKECGITRKTDTCEDDNGKHSKPEEKVVGDLETEIIWKPSGSEDWKEEDIDVWKTWSSQEHCGPKPIRDPTEYKGKSTKNCEYTLQTKPLSADKICKGTTMTYPYRKNQEACPDKTLKVNGTEEPKYTPNPNICIGEPYIVSPSNCEGRPKSFVGTNTDGDCSSLVCSTNKLNWKACGKGEIITMSNPASSLYVKLGREKLEEVNIDWKTRNSKSGYTKPTIVDDNKSSTMVEIKPGPSLKTGDGLYKGNKFYNLEVNPGDYTGNEYKLIDLKYINPVVREI